MLAAEGGRRFAFGAGSVHVGDDGAVVQVRHPHGERPVLLQEDPGAPESVMHESARRWGKGFLVVDGAGHRFDSPSELTWRADGVDLRHEIAGLDLSISRRFGASGWTETHEVRNPADREVSIGSWAISTPWRDVYSSSGDSLRQAVHTHVWTGGADAWVWAVPMDGTGPGLGLHVSEGELWAYSVESRDPVTGSNLRGHLYLHVTDHSRAPHAMGGQPRVTLPPAAATGCAGTSTGTTTPRLSARTATPRSTSRCVPRRWATRCPRISSREPCRACHCRSPPTAPGCGTSTWSATAGAPG